MTLRKITFLLAVAIAIKTSAQSNQDYVLLVKGDTLRGAMNFFLSENIDRVNISTSGKKKTFSALQVRSVVKSGEQYQPIRYENTIRFMKVLKSNYLSLYAFNAIETGSWEGRFLTKKDGTGMEVPNIGFKKIMTKYLRDCPSVETKLNNGELSRRDIDKIVELYNACLEAKTSQTIASKPEAPTPDSEKILAVKKLIEKVEAENFLTKKDALDLLVDLKGKVAKNEKIPNYLLEGLKSYLNDTPALAKEADDLISLLKK